ncbi:hypothetical protein ACHFJ0_08790 [Paracoccus sp. NGMCC 1.201697]|uniref:Uncharacterized protein n=1 Tax=Paracoccus broussonetiae subsp. drimophilus TaxID=3373869 RepID=A0ABW7LJ25_9RHOB
MPETLLNASTILLFGRLVEDLQVNPSASDPGHSGTPGQLEQQLRGEDPNFARIYGFGYAGVYHLLPVPALFLVHGPGAPAAAALTGLKAPQADAKTEERGTAPAQPIGALLPEDIVAWSYDKADYTIRLDVQSGMLEQLLLGGGPDARGMSVQGMSVQGMSVQGMSVRGMSLRGGDKD